MKLVEDERRREDGEGTDPGSESGTGQDGLGRLAAERGISEDVLRSAGIRLDVGSGRHAGWWRIPYPHRNGIWKTRYRNPDPEGRPKYLDDPGADFHLYNPLGLGPGEEEIWFAEGEFDTLALVDQGLKAIGIHGVSNVRNPPEDGDGGEEPEGRFRKSWLHLFTDTLCVAMFDNDDAGRKAGRRLARGLEGEAFDEWPDEYGDCNDWWKADPDSMSRAVEGYRYRLRRSRGL